MSQTPSAKSSPTKHKRRTQRERRETTRRRLLEATIECLVRYGYAGSTTTLIADRAGVSRGAQLHHFRAKAELVRAAVEHLTEQRIAEFRDAMSRVPEGSDRITAAIDLLYECVRGECFLPWLELVVAARTDPDLDGPVREMSQRLRVEVQRTFEELFADEAAGNPFAEIAPMFSTALMDGLALQGVINRDEQREAKIIDALKQIAILVQLARPGR